METSTRASTVRGAPARSRDITSPRGPDPSRGSRMLMPAAAAAMAFVLGAAAGLSMAPTAAETARPETDAREGLVDVLVARRVVPAGTELGYAVVTRSQMPARFVTGSMVRPEHVGQLVGEMVLVTILEGEPILWSYLAAGASESVCDWIREANERRADE